MELAIVLTIVVVVLIWFAVRGWQALGRSKAEALAAKRAADQAKRAKEIDENVRGMSDDELNDRLRGDS